MRKQAPRPQRARAIINYLRSHEGRRVCAWLRKGGHEQAPHTLRQACEAACTAPGAARLEPASVLRRLSAAWHA